MGQVVGFIAPAQQRNRLSLRGDDRTGAWVIETDDSGGIEPPLTVTFMGPRARERAIEFFRNLALDETDQHSGAPHPSEIPNHAIPRR